MSSGRNVPPPTTRTSSSSSARSSSSSRGKIVIWAPERMLMPITSTSSSIATRPLGLGVTVGVDTDYPQLARLLGELVAVGGVGDLPLEPPGFDAGHSSAEAVDPLQVRLRLFFDPVGQCLDCV